MNRIRQPEMREGVGQKQVAEVVGRVGRGDGMRTQEREAKNHRQDGQQEQAPKTSLCQPAGGPLQIGPCEDERDQQRSQREDEGVAYAEPNRVVQRQIGSDKIGDHGRGMLPHSAMSGRAMVRHM